MVYPAAPITGEALVAQCQAVSVNATPEIFFTMAHFFSVSQKNGADTHLLLRFILSAGLFSVKATAYPSTFTNIDYFPIITEIPNCLNSDAEAIEQILLEYIILFDRTSLRD